MRVLSITLNRVPVGLCCTVISLTSDGMLRRRMFDLGIITGTKIKVLHKSPAGNPIAYLIRGTVIALRNEDAKKILVKICRPKRR
ncbi:ferrous iron transport protein A [Clostridia bacterium]|nr:ferrous iron transport protein A [Clostridia bacterium]